MIFRKKPYISSLQTKFDNVDTQEVYFDDITSKFFMTIIGPSGFSLRGENYRRYIHMVVENVFKTYPDGKLNVRSEFLNMDFCTEEQFGSGEFEK